MLLDSKAMQRLRNIRQLAMAHMVYPGCNHTRFEHSIGVMHVANKMVDAIENQLNSKRLKEDFLDGWSIDSFKRRIRFAALLHDVGHAPFCHVTEPIIMLCTQAKPRNKMGITPEDYEKIHENITISIIKNDPIISDTLGRDTEAVIRILSLPKDGNRFLAREIISGPLDADKQDYLLRDSHYSGAKYGVFDIDRLIDSIVPIRDRKHVYLACKEESICAVEQFVIAKYFISEQIYFHKVRIACDDMVVRGLKLLTESGSQIGNDISALFTYKDNKAYIKNFLEWDDRSLLDRCYPAKGSAGDLFNRLRERRLLKLRLNLGLSGELSPGAIEELSAMKLEDEGSREIATQIAKHFQRKKDYVCVTVAKARFPRIIGDLYKVDPDDIMVKDERSGKPVQLYAKSTILQGIPEAPLRLQVVIEDDSLSKRKYKGKNLERGLRSFIKDYYRSR